jgi:hypothetical protein
MNVTVTNLDMSQITYGYSPDHYADVVKFYSDAVQNGEIYTYTVSV